MTAYAPTSRTRFGRLPKRGSYDRALVHQFLDEALHCHVGFVADGAPFVIPIVCWRVGEELLIHGATSSRMIRALQAGAPACVTVTHLDGLVMAKSAFHHSVNYRSVMVFGTARTIDDPAEKAAVLAALIEHVAAGRMAHVRPPNAKEMKATTVLAFPLVEVSAKSRSGPPVDDAEDLALPVWAGVVPLMMVRGGPVEG